MRAVIDTNILVSALLRPGSTPDAVLQAIVSGRLAPVVCDAIMAEYAEVLSRPRFAFPARAVDELLMLLGQQSAWVTLPPYDGQPALPDPDDWPFVACALAAGCSVLTGNTRHFPAAAGIEVLTAREWLTSRLPAPATPRGL
jgi:putative PIN family toxin of toxin-antitoxin system